MTTWKLDAWVAALVIGVALIAYGAMQGNGAFVLIGVGIMVGGLLITQ